MNENKEKEEKDVSVNVALVAGANSLMPLVGSPAKIQHLSTDQFNAVKFANIFEAESITRPRENAIS